ncbi:MAG: caspase family protein [Candidatus Helarchaeota archaeon]
MLLFISFFVPLLTVANKVTVNKISIERRENKIYKSFDNGTEYYALIVGITKYKFYEYDAGFADVNAKNLCELLKTKKNWKKENIILLLNEEATKANLLNGIRWLVNKADEDDIVMFFYSGHGVKHQQSFNHSYITFYEIKSTKDYANMSSDTELDKEFSKLNSSRIVFIFDCCWSARMTDLIKPGRVILSAGGKFFSCVADWDDNIESGIFSYYIRQGLEGYADYDGNNIISAEETFNYAYKKTMIHSFIFHMSLLRYPREYVRLLYAFPFVQRTYMYDENPGEMPLVYL